VREEQSTGAIRRALLSQVSHWPAPKALRYLFQRDELIKPPDDEFPADLGGRWLHLDDLQQYLEVHVRGQVVVAEPVEPGLIWGRSRESHRRTLRRSESLS